MSNRRRGRAALVGLASSALGAAACGRSEFGTILTSVPFIVHGPSGTTAFTLSTTTTSTQAARESFLYLSAVRDRRIA